MVGANIHAQHPNETNRPTHNPPKRYQPLHAICPNETVGAVPVCPPERPRSGVSIPKIHGIMCGNERWMRPCGATRAGTQAPPLPISTKPCGVPLPHYIVHSIVHANRTVCPYPIGVILSIAQGWQVQRSLPWVTDASEGATPLGVVLFLITHHYHTWRMISPHEN